MRIFFLFCMLLVALFCFSTVASAQADRTPRVQKDILRVAPSDTAAFVPMVMPQGSGEPTVEVLSRQGEWENVKLYYRFKYNGSADPNICAMSLFEETFTGFRKIESIK